MTENIQESKEQIMGESLLNMDEMPRTINGFPSMVEGDDQVIPDTTTEEYAEDQRNVNTKKTRDFLLPLLQKYNASSVLDIGCGTGTSVAALINSGVDAYGVDLPGLSAYWAQSGFAFDRFAIVDSGDFRLPFSDNVLDFAYTFGVIEHVGTSDGHADRLENYHDVRKQWLREIFRVIKPGAHMLIAGPNRNFPVDAAHGLDSKASSFEGWLSEKAGVSVHKTWGENFLWSYRDFPRYLGDLPYEMTALSTNGYIGFSRVPTIVRPAVEFYVRNIPNGLLATGFNPWVMGLIRKLG